VLLGRFSGLIRAFEKIELSSKEVVIPIVLAKQFWLSGYTMPEDFAKRNNMKIRLVLLATNLNDISRNN